MWIVRIHWATQTTNSIAQLTKFRTGQECVLFELLLLMYQKIFLKKSKITFRNVKKTDRLMEDRFVEIRSNGKTGTWNLFHVLIWSRSVTCASHRLRARLDRDFVDHRNWILWIVALCTEILWVERGLDIGCGLDHPTHDLELVISAANYFTKTTHWHLMTKMDV